MTKFKLYEDILSWNRYFYDVEANTIEEAVEKVRYEEVDSEQIYEVIDELDPVDNNGSPTREIYNDKDELTRSIILLHTIRRIESLLHTLIKRERQNVEEKEELMVLKDGKDGEVKSISKNTEK